MSIKTPSSPIPPKVHNYRPHIVRPETGPMRLKSTDREAGSGISRSSQICEYHMKGWQGRRFLLNV